ncbi:hypothetical protein Ae201684_008713 [Aphanomyces euteiches]|uniref:DDE Tnp4 domain-containing protein n=1 Tax=Aphanomyces euteiches TaxID=100861 RepID=A0A6G0X3X7_9STRA|nr:hypothetical protein Ae201684_008713 [Aphanomyces euteiches]
MNAATVAVITSAMAAATAAANDGRCNRAPASNKYSFRSDTWTTVQASTAYSGWYKKNLRCTQAAFNVIASRVAERWTDVHKPIHHNSSFSIVDRVAVAINYLTHGGELFSSGQVFGMSEARAHTYSGEVIDVLMLYLEETIHLPDTPDAWRRITEGFERQTGFPGVVGAIDGSLVKIKRFKDHEGWYCRKGFPAFNIQVDDKLKFMSFSIRSGSQNDKSLFNRSQFGLNDIPSGHYFLGDAGYVLYTHLMTPYPIRLGMSDVAHYNLIHSRTRICVKRAFGRWKNIFRIFKKDFIQHLPEEMARLIKATMILHNWFIDLQAEFDCAVDPDEDVSTEDWMHIGGDLPRPNSEYLISGDLAEARRDLLKTWLYDNVLA